MMYDEAAPGGCTAKFTHDVTLAETIHLPPLRGPVISTAAIEQTWGFRLSFARLTTRRKLARNVYAQGVLPCESCSKSIGLIVYHREDQQPCNRKGGIS